MKPSPGKSAAMLATAQMDELLQPALEDLRSALATRPSGVYVDVSLVRSAMARMNIAIDQAQRIARRVGWPLSASDRRHILTNLSAGIAQRERRPFPAGDLVRSNHHPAPPSDEAP